MSPRAELRKLGITLAADANVIDCTNLLREILREGVILPPNQSQDGFYDNAKKHRLIRVAGMFLRKE